MQTSEEQIVIDNRLAPYIGSDPVYDSEHGGMLHRARMFSSIDFLIPTDQLSKSLEEYSARIQEAVNLHEDFSISLSICQGTLYTIIIAFFSHFCKK